MSGSDKTGKRNVLVVLSTTRTSDEVIDYAVERAGEAKAKLVALYIIETNRAKEVFDTFTDIGFIGDSPSIKVTESLIREYRQRGYEELGKLQIKTMEAGVDFDPLMEEGDFVETVLDIIDRHEIALAILVKRKKGSLMKYFSKSLVEEVKERASCEVQVFVEE